MASSPQLTSKCSSSLVPTWFFHFAASALSIFLMSVRSPTFHGGFASMPFCRRRWSSTSISSTSGGGTDDGLGHVAVCCNGVPGGGGAPFLTLSSTALQSARCGVGLLLIASGTAFTGGPSMLLVALLECLLNKVSLAPRFSDKERVCDRDRFNRQTEDETERISLSEPEEAVRSKTRRVTHSVTSQSLTQSPPSLSRTKTASTLSSRGQKREKCPTQTRLLFISTPSFCLPPFLNTAQYHHSTLFSTGAKNRLHRNTR